MKISLNRQLDTDQLIDLENHVIEVAEEAYMTEQPRPDLDQFAVRGYLEVQSEELAKAIIDFISQNIPRVIIWKDEKKVVDKFGNSPLDIEGEKDRREFGPRESLTPAQFVESLLAEDTEIPSLRGKGIVVTQLPDGPNGSRRFKVEQQSAGGMEDDHWIANQISWHYGAKNQFTVGDRKGNSFVVHIPKGNQISVFVPDTLEWEAVDAAAAEVAGASAYGVGNGVYLKGTHEQLRKLLSNEDFTIEWYGGTLTPEQIESMLEENE